MGRFTTLIVGAAVGALLAVVGVAAAMAALNPSATQMADEAKANGQGGKAAEDPLDPPNFYGAR
jgi:hypothetical protein